MTRTGRLPHVLGRAVLDEAPAAGTQQSPRLGDDGAQVRQVTDQRTLDDDVDARAGSVVAAASPRTSRIRPVSRVASSAAASITGLASTPTTPAAPSSTPARPYAPTPQPTSATCRPRGSTTDRTASRHEVSASWPA